MNNNIISEPSIFRNHRLFYLSGETYRIRKDPTLYYIYKQNNADNVFVFANAVRAKSYIDALRKHLFNTAR